MNWLISVESLAEFLKKYPKILLLKSMEEFLKISIDGFLNKVFDKVLEECLKEFLKRSKRNSEEIYSGIYETIHVKFSKIFYLKFQ